MAQLLVDVFKRCEADVEAGAVVTVDDPGAPPRTRRLPLRA